MKIWKDVGVVDQKFSNSKLFTIYSLSEMQNKFPQDSWWIQYYKQDAEDTKVAFYDGDLQLASLELDWRNEDSDEADVAIIFINGSLTVTGNIVNENTDGAVSLMIMGDLYANNIAVGGQEIYVVGNVTVKEVFCGSYNHGETKIKGNLTTAVLIEDDYRCLVEGEKRVECYFDGVGEYATYQGLSLSIRDVLVDEALLEREEWNLSGFSFVCLQALLKEGNRPLKNYEKFMQNKSKEIQSYFADCRNSEETIAKLTASILMPEDDISYDLEENGVSFTVKKAHLDDEGEQENSSVFIDDGNMIYFAYFTPAGTELLYKIESDEQAEWEEITEDSPHEYNLFTKHWVDLLTYVSLAQYYIPRIDYQYIERMLTHPKVKELDSADGENDGLWDGEKYYRFYQYADGSGAEIDIQAPDGTRFFYEVENNRVLRSMKISDDHEEERISYTDLTNWERSDSYFKEFQQFVEMVLDGE